MTPEGRVKALIRGLLKMHKAYQFWPVQTGFGADTLDIIGCRPCDGRFFVIETKAPGKEPTGRQKKRLREVLEANGAAFVFDGSGADLRLIETWLTTPSWGKDSPAEKLIDQWDIHTDKSDEVIV